MENVYLATLVGVVGMIVAAMAEGIRAVAAKPVWQQSPMASESNVTKTPLVVMEVGDRRKQQLPFVGVDRRKAATSTADIRKVG